MTCIIGYIEPSTKEVWIGGDSCGTAGSKKIIRKDPKVFHRKRDPSASIGRWRKWVSPGAQRGFAPTTYS